MNPDPGRFIEVNGTSLYVEEHGAGVPVLLMHGFPDSARLWRDQVPFLVGNGFRVITPDMRGFGRSGRPQEVAAYRLQNVVADVTGLLDAFGIEAAHVVGHDWGAAAAWLTATFAPDRVRRLVVISVPHPLAPVTLRQHEMAWYQLFFQFVGVAEATVSADDWAWLRMFSRGAGDTGQWIEDLSRPGALTAALNWAGPTWRRACRARSPACRRSRRRCSASGQTPTTTSTASGCGSQRPGWRGRGATRRSRAPATGYRGTPPAS